MSQLTQALVGWLVIMGMVFGGVGILFFVMSAIRALATVIRQVRESAPKAQEREAMDLYRGASDNPAF